MFTRVANIKVKEGEIKEGMIEKSIRKHLIGKRYYVIHSAYLLYDESFYERRE